MKKNWFTFIICCLVAALSACQNEDELSSSNVGYLRLSLGVNTYINSRAGEEIYDPEQIAVQIISAEGEVVKETSDWENWAGEQIALPVGTYTLKASSAGFDGATSGFDKPYYAGSADITIEKNKEVNETITCTLANVKVTVTFDSSFRNAFASAHVDVDDNAGNAGISPLTFTMGEADKSGYFPVTDLKAVVSATNKNGVTNTQENVIEGVKARDHYILNYFVVDNNGDGNVTVTVDPSTKTYTYTFYIPTAPTTQLAVGEANAWAKLAYLTGDVVATKDELTPAEMSFQYRKKDAAEWLSVPAELSEGIYKGTAASLDPETVYEYRMVYGEEEFVSDTKEFTTEAATALYNGSLDNWYQNQKAWYPILEAEATSFDNHKGYLNSFWDSGNLGAAMMSKNPTQQETSDVRSGSAARLESQFVGIFGIGKFAAGNLYTGHYYETVMSPMGAKLFFGQPFTSRPVQLKGWFKYTRGTDVDYPSGTDSRKSELQATGGDLCSIYIALADNDGLDGGGQNYAFEIDNTLDADDPEHFMYKNAIDYTENNPSIIAYGCITDEEAKGTGEWQEFTIDLKYRDLTRIPKYIIVVASASKYGDYFTGSSKSVMLIDEFELVYDGKPVVQ